MRAGPAVKRIFAVDEIVDHPVRALRRTSGDAILASEGSLFAWGLMEES